MPYDDVQKVSYDEFLPNDQLNYITGAQRALPEFSYRTHLKRGLDLFLVLVSLPVVLPLVLIMAALVALDGHNPFYSQSRVGRRGMRFRIFKIRTMVPNADEILEEHLSGNPELRAEWDKTQKLQQDIRVTRVGYLLRKTSLDELPQLLNVFNGTMSLVGPRPMMVDQQKLYPGRSYYRLRPGITGLWQISDRNKCSFQDRAVYDDQYDRDVSLTTDLRVLFRTVRVVFQGTGC